MERGKTLLDKAAKVAGSFYALSKATGIPQSNMTNVMKGKRGLPMEWVPLLCEIAGADLGTELALVMAEQLPEESRARRILEKVRATSVAAMLLFSLIVAGSLTPGQVHSKVISGYQLDNVYIVECLGRFWRWVKKSLLVLILSSTRRELNTAKVHRWFGLRHMPSTA